MRFSKDRVIELEQSEESQDDEIQETSSADTPQKLSIDHLIKFSDETSSEINSDSDEE